MKIIIGNTFLYDGNVKICNRYVRGGDWEIATVWKNRRVANTDVIMDGHTVSSAITILKRVEGLLILYGKHS